MLVLLRIIGKSLHNTRRARIWSAAKDLKNTHFGRYDGGDSWHPTCSEGPMGHVSQEVVCVALVLLFWFLFSLL
jgi:hypothetical protein